MSAASRRHRGYATQALVAEYMRGHGFPYATDAGPGRSGVDVLNAPGLAVEVKAVRELDLPGWLRQATRFDRVGVPIVVERPDGYGPASIESWPFITTVHHGFWLVRRAGFGEPESGAA